MPDVFQRLARTGKLPSPSGVGARILSLTQDESATIEDIARVLAQDPALTGRILRVANSTTSAGSVPFSTTREAAMRLGLRAVSSIAVSFTLVSSNREGHCEEFDYPAYWSASMATAVAAQALCQELAPNLAPGAFTAGLLLEIGRLGLASAEPAIFGGVLRACRSGEHSELALERRTLGIDHAELGARLVSEWGMPVHVAEAIHAATGDTPQATESLSEDAALLAKVLSTAGHLARRHIGKRVADWESDAALAVQLQTLDLVPDQLAALLPVIEEQWRELAQDLAFKPLPPWDACEEVQEAADEPQPEGPLILVVDDDPISLKVLTNCLHRAGHRVAPASSGEEALALALQHEPAILITAWEMDGMSGQSLCRALLRCEVGRQLFRIVLTSEADERADVEALQAEAHDVVRKPIHPRDLLARVAVGLSLAESQGELAQVDSMTVRAKSLSETLLHDGHSPEPETLPGLYSRAFATGRLAVAFEDEARPLSIALLAIDALHLPESPLLSKDLTRRLGELLRSSLRKDDVLANTSEGRFLLLCPGADLREASELAERMRAGVDEACIGIGGYVGPITISAGVAERTPSMRSPAVLMVVASTALELGATEAPNQVHPAA